MVLSERDEALSFLLDNIFIQCGAKLYQQIVGISKGTNCALSYCRFVSVLLQKKHIRKASYLFNISY